MRFQPYPQTVAVPNIIVDGPANASTVLALSHWAKSGTPGDLQADTSTEIVFKYLDAPRFAVETDAVSNNHFDEDGLLGIFALLEPETAQPCRDLLIDASRAGDFGVYRARDAARIAFALGGLSDPDVSPLPAAIFTLPYAEQTGALYAHALGLLPALLSNLADYRSLWQVDEAQLAHDERLLDNRIITIEERADLDLAIVRAPATAARIHPFAINSRTSCARVALVQGNQFAFQYRYESWVQMASRRPLLRVDLSMLAEELNREQVLPGRWQFDRVDSITPRLHFEGGGASSLAAAEVLKRLEHALLSGSPAWNPYQ
jgi:hypothetical protein